MLKELDFFNPLTKEEETIALTRVANSIMDYQSQTLIRGSREMDTMEGFFELMEVSMNEKDFDIISDFVIMSIEEAKNNANWTIRLAIGDIFDSVILLDGGIHTNPSSKFLEFFLATEKVNHPSNHQNRISLESYFQSQPSILSKK